MSDDQAIEILKEIQGIRQAMAVHGESHVAQSRRCASHGDRLDKLANTLYGNGQRGLTTRVAVHSWAIGGVCFAVGGLVTAAIGQAVQHLFCAG